MYGHCNGVPEAVVTGYDTLGAFAVIAWDAGRFWTLVSDEIPVLKFSHNVYMMAIWTSECTLATATARASSWSPGTVQACTPLLSPL